MKKILWVVVSGLMVLALVVACAPAAPTPPTTPTTPTAPTAPIAPTTPTKPAPEPAQKEPAAPAPETPRYGGTITYRISNDPTNFDSGTQRSGGALVGTVYEQFVGSDWLRGPAGSGVTNYAAGGGSMEDSLGTHIAESWQMPEKGVWKLKIRQGVRWQPAPSEAGRLMAGRELTADDIVSGFNRLLNRDGKSPDSWIVPGQPRVARSATIEKTGPWEVTIKTPEEYMTAFVWVIQGAGFYRVYPPEVIAKYGSLSNWRNAVGTGPYMLVDYVPGSQMLFKKHPNYWGKDPVGPGKGNQLPYADTLRELIIPDLSTTYAALRTGKLDLQMGVVLTDAQSLWKTAPRLDYIKYLGGSFVIGMRQDKKDKPYSDVRVRQALMLATDFEAIKRNYFSGEAEIIIWPANSNMGFWEPLDKQPQAVQELYRYNPEKARQLLKEAGYPNGFKVKVVVQTAAERVDELSIFKDMWQKVGVELVLDIKETGVYAQLTAAGNPYDEMLYRVVGPAFNMHLYQAYTRATAIWNPSHVNDPPGTVPYLEDLFLEQDKYLFVDMPRVYEAVKKVNRYVMEQAYAIPRPTPYTYSFWWPWLKNNYGQGTGFVKYSWVGQDLKKSMGY